MRSAQIVQDLRRRGFRLRVDNGRLMVAPASQLTEEDRRLIREYRDAIIVVLEGESSKAETRPWRGVEIRQFSWGWVALRDPFTGKWYEIRWRDAPQWVRDEASDRKLEAEVTAS